MDDIIRIVFYFLYLSVLCVKGIKDFLLCPNVGIETGVQERVVVPAGPCSRQQLKGGGRERFRCD